MKSAIIFRLLAVTRMFTKYRQRLECGAGGEEALPGEAAGFRTRNSCGRGLVFSSAIY